MLSYLYEVDVRALVLAFVCGVALAVVSAQATPLAPKPTTLEPGAMSPIQLASGGCGWGWHRHYWKDRWGNLRPGRCVKNWWW